ncbi:hypothetical protein B9Z55_026247 [Caenorhabditis nigoni]|uniref:RING-type domain-containing protein n=1 Tax=Caenorhabditis nigoni TaxID=1611254 RepID=A0A2G5T1Y0_9PELO|nr:hypothetical protein B9Z55_026247 [Caenorhabditis nigoni]
MADDSVLAAVERASLLQRIHRLDRDCKHKIKNFEFHKQRRVELQKAIESCLECIICNDSFDSKESTPRVLGCGHVFCEKCVFEMLERERRPIRFLMGMRSNKFPEESFTNTISLDSVDLVVQHETVILKGDETSDRLETIIKRLEQNSLDVNKKKVLENDRHTILDKLSNPIRNCARCHNQYHNTPFILKCGHVFCEACNILFFERFKKIEPACVKCPQCNKLSHYQRNETRGTAIYTFINSSQMH